MVWLLAAAGAHAALSGNLVVNGGFETGDFSGWTLTDNRGYVYIQQAAYQPYVHSGSYAAQFGGGISPTSLEQAQLLATTPGTSYLIDFWLKNNSSARPSLFTVSWDGTEIFSLTDAPSFDWTEYRFVETADQGFTQVAFGFEQDNSFFEFDDVSVAAVPEASGWYAGIAVLCLMMGGLFREIRRSQRNSP